MIHGISAPTLHSWKRYYALCILILLAHNIYSIEHVWRIHQSVYITQTLGHMRIHYTSFITSTLHILHGGCVTRASRIHCIYFIEHMWHIPTDVYTTHKSPLCGYTTYTPWCIHSICTMEDVSCIRGAAYAEQYYDPSCVGQIGQVDRTDQWGHTKMVKMTKWT